LFGSRQQLNSVHRIQYCTYSLLQPVSDSASEVFYGSEGSRASWAGDSHEHEREGEDSSDEGEGNVHVDPLHPKGTRRITESSITRVGDSFEEDDAPIFGLCGERAGV